MIIFIKPVKDTFITASSLYFHQKIPLIGNIIRYVSFSRQKFQKLSQILLYLPLIPAIIPLAYTYK